MTNRETMELFIEENGQETVAYPFVEKDHVVFGNGMGIEEVIEQDISMPTVTHEEVSFKVGVGDQDVSSSIVDSSVGEMVIKGQTYQNILPEPSTHILTNDKEMFKVNEGLDSSVEIVDGVAKSAILSGNTLVNLVPKKIIDHIASSDWDGYCCLVQNSKQSFDQWRTLQDLKPNTKYYISCYVEIFEDANNKDYCLNNPSVESIFGDSMIVNGVGRYQWLSTTKSELTDEMFIVLRSQNAHARGAIKIRDIMIIEYREGMENWDIPYFEGMQSVKMPVLTTTGKNLFDINFINTIYSNFNDDATVKIDNNSFTMTSSANKRSYLVQNKPIILKPNTVYTLSLTGYSTGDYRRINIESSKGVDKNDYRSITLDTNEATYSTQFTTNNSGHVYINFYPTTSAESLTTISNIQLEEGRAATSYEPFKSNILHTPEEVVLRSLPNGVCDTLNLNTGEYVQRIKEIVLDGSSRNDFVYHNVLKEHDGQILRMIINNCSFYNKSKYGNCDKLPFYHTQKDNTTLECVFPYNGDNHFYIQIKTSRIDGADSLGHLSAELKQSFCNWLAQNPLTVQYELATPIVKTVDLSIIDQDGNTPEGLHFFKDGHIQLSSGADNSLIPTLDYQAKTSNSYVMDLMKANTRYTMKAKSASGNFTLGGSSYSLGTNRVFSTTGAEFNANNMMVITGAYEDLMILEGELTSKTIPYSKGIKSAFEDESKIEVLSTGKNLFDRKLSEYDYLGNYNKNEVIIGDNFIEWNASSTYKGAAYYHFYVKPNTSYTLSLERNIMQRNCTTIYDGFVTSNINSISNMEANKNNISFVTLSNKITIRFSNGTILNETFKIYNVQLEESDTVTTYEPYKSNSTKIPLLSPLRSLPNGVCDELIIDRMKKKATLVQRVGVGVLDGTQSITMADSSVDTSPYQPFYCHDVFGNMAVVPRGVVVVRCDKLLANFQTPAYRSLTVNAIYQYTDSSARLAGQITRKDLRGKGVNDWFRANPTTIYYQLETPVVTEIDLEGFPFIYKDGHIFLNSEIAPTTQITYSISQQHQIDASTQDLIRHEQELVYLYKLIAQYIQVDYQSTLLSLDLKLK